MRPRKGILAAVPALLALSVVLLWQRRSLPLLPGAASPRSTRLASAADDLPRIDLGRLAADRPAVKVGRRDLFEFGVAERNEDARTAPTPASTFPRVPEVAATPGPVYTVAPRALTLDLKYIGSLESARGLRVAVLLTDRNEVLTGQAGELVANRYKIVRIGYESVEVLDVGSGQTRRIPLKGN